MTSFARPTAVTAGPVTISTSTRWTRRRPRTSACSRDQTPASTAMPALSSRSAKTSKPGSPTLTEAKSGRDRTGNCTQAETARRRSSILLDDPNARGDADRHPWHRVAHRGHCRTDVRRRERLIAVAIAGVYVKSLRTGSHRCDCGLTEFLGRERQIWMLAQPARAIEARHHLSHHSGSLTGDQTVRLGV